MERFQLENSQRTPTTIEERNNLNLNNDLFMEVVSSTVSVCLLVRLQDYTKTTEGISTTPGWRMGLSLEKTPLTFRIDPVKWTDRGFRTL